MSALSRFVTIALVAAALVPGSPTPAGSAPGRISDLAGLPVPAGTTCHDGRVSLGGRGQVPFFLSPFDRCVYPGGDPAAHEPGPTDCVVPGYDDRCEAWASVPYDGGASGVDTPSAAFSGRTIGASPDGSMVFVAGTSDAAPGGPVDWDAVTIAYDGATGEQRWVRTFPGVGTRTTAISYALAVAPDGQSVYTLVDTSGTPAGNASPVILANDAETGEPTWIHDPVRSDSVRDVEVSPDGSVVYYGGTTTAGGRAMFVAAVAAGTGKKIWESTFAGESGAAGNVIAVSPDGSRVFVAGGEVDSRGSRIDYTMAAFESANRERLGELLWASHDELTQPEGIYTNNGPVDIAVSPDSSQAFVTGIDWVDLTDQSIYDESALLTYAHDALSGERLWKGRYAGPDVGHYHDALFDGTLAVSPDGSRVFVAGHQSRPIVFDSSQGWAVVAYDAASGNREWAEDSRDQTNIVKLLGRYAALAVDDDQVFVAGYRGVWQAPEYGVAAYASATGTQDWMARFTRGRNLPGSLAASPEGGRVFVTGSSRLPGVSAVLVNASLPGDSSDIQTVAFDTARRP